MSRLACVVCLAGLVAPATAAPDVTIGTSAPMSGAQLPPHGKWFVVCEARRDTNGDGKVDARFDGRFARGDRYEPYLVLGAGAGIEIEHVAAKSDDGAWLAVVRGGKLELHDTTKSKAITLAAADLTYDSDWSSRHEPRFASIGASGKYMTYLTPDAIVIRDLATATERTVKVTGKLWRAEVEPGERWAKVRVLRKDTNRDGKIDWPGSLAGSWLFGCTSDTLHRRFPTDGDTPTTLWLDLASGTVVADPTVIGTAGDELIRRRQDGTLLLGTTVVAKAACRGSVAATLSNPPRMAINCGTKQEADDYTEKPVFVVGPNGFRKDTSFGLSYSDDGFRGVYAGDRYRNTFDKVSLDLATGDVITLPDEIAGYEDNLVLMRSPKGHAIFDLTTRKSVLLAGSPTTEIQPADIDDGIVMLDDKRWDVVTGAQIVRPSEDVHRRMSDGRYLVSPKGAHGPLKLVSP